MVRHIYLILCKPQGWPKRSEHIKAALVALVNGTSAAEESK